ncbi:hypothetical protein PR202_ga23878 [Eleusine coracana subsp. coracana]|uniref:Disease resistance N-terminal domain-containing protein n=1 Tax=Eleusine coracana subsp. coracana TaxID=191504 RepID=A0AAV5D724_ELECO|nr:hypothetical protein PR202_ga23878 [Eleusine coracana subsp. coracana]
MDALVSAVASDLIGRFISFLIGKYQESSAADISDTIVRLQRALLRARVVVEEAEGRQITNRAMLQQLNLLRREMCQAAYALDAFRWRDRRSQATVRRSRVQAGPPPSSDCSHYLSDMVGSLEAVLGDMREFVVLLNGYPRFTKQPYTAYLCMESCMFGRQMEKEEIISFLWRPSQDLDVLPIIGPLGVGKRTLVEHICLDERVRERFGKIHRLRSTDLDLYSYGHHWSSFDFTTRSLMVIDMVDGDVDAEESWRRFYSAIRLRAHIGSKVIVISRMEATHSNLGTVTPLRLRPLRREDLWYFFRALAFGAADPDEHPDLAHLAMTMCTCINGGLALFTVANIVAASLRADPSVRSWRRLFKVIFETAVLQFGTAADDKAEHYYYLCSPLGDAGASCLFYNRRKLTNVARSELPKVTMLEMLTSGSLPSAGKTQFDVLMWESRIPPYASYVATCDTDKAHHQQVVALKKPLLNKRRRDHQEDDPSN